MEWFLTWLQLMPEWTIHVPFMLLAAPLLFTLSGSVNDVLTGLQRIFFRPSRIAVVRALCALVPIGVVTLAIYGVLSIPGQSVALSRRLFHALYPGTLQSGYRRDLIQVLGWAGVNTLFAIVSWRHFQAELRPLRRSVRRDLRSFDVSPQLRRKWLIESENVARMVGMVGCTIMWSALGLLPFATERNVTLIDASSVGAFVVVFIFLAMTSVLPGKSPGSLLVCFIWVLASAYTGKRNSPLLSIAMVMVPLAAYYYERFVARRTASSLVAVMVAWASGVVGPFGQRLHLVLPTDETASGAMFFLTLFLWLWPAAIGFVLLRLSPVQRERRQLPRSTNRTKRLLAYAWPAFILVAVLGLQGWHARLVALIMPVAAGGVLLSVVSLRRVLFVKVALIAVAILSVVVGLRTLSQLGPDLDFAADGARAAASGHKDRSFFERRSLSPFITAWESHRADTYADAPVLLIAAAGGGIRAAAHVADSLAAADAITNGHFGDRVFAISAVSGGSLGAALWESSLKDGLGVSARQAQVPGSEAVARMRPFFENDFVSPVASRYFAWDLLKSLIWNGTDANSRDSLLVDLWSQAYGSLRSRERTQSSRNPFDDSVATLNSQPGHLPLLLLNASSASDGKVAVNSSAGGVFPGEHLLDEQKPLAAAVLDSARFPIVSTVGVACSDDGVWSPRPLMNADVCGARGFPVAVADGGYIDNSGADALSYLVDELVRAGVRMERIYVVYVSSNPEADLPTVEGNRFKSGSALGTLFAAGSIFENARAGRAGYNVETLAKRLPEGHLVRWSLSSPILFEILQKQGPAGESDADKAKRVERGLTSAPLGWTLDGDAITDIERVSLHHAAWLASKDCAMGDDADRALCSALSGKRTAKDAR